MFSGNGRIRAAAGLIAALLLMVPAMSACSEEEEVILKDRELALAYTGFGIDMMKVLAPMYEGENIFISPSSIAFALAMTYNGAETTTADAMANTLKIGALSRDEVNIASKELTSDLTGEETDVELSIANALWLAKGFTFNKDFLQRNERYFGAEMFNGVAAGPINAWVSENTKEKIEKILDSIPSNTIAVLVNAIYFKGTWAREFDAKLTADGDFHLAGGSTIQHPMMKQSGKYRYMQNEHFQAVSLPYGDGRMSMYIFLPAEETGLGGFYNELSAQCWDEWMNGFGEKDGSIEIPKYMIEFESRLKPPLKQLGMEVAFSPSQADFSGMCKVKGENIFIDDVIHKTFVEVNEEGTEAAAATAVTMRLTSVAIKEEPFRMVVDRPFFVAIRDNETGLILFIGAIVDPS